MCVGDSSGVDKSTLGKMSMIMQLPKKKCCQCSKPRDFVFGVLTLTGCQMPTKASLLLPSASGQEKENIMKGL